MNRNEFKCDICGQVFEKGLSDEEAKEQLNETFGDVSVDDCNLVCDDCYNKMMDYGLFDEHVI